VTSGAASFDPEDVNAARSDWIQAEVANSATPAVIMEPKTNA
jgi:hypothetical protein